MAYTKTPWKDRVVQFARRFTLKSNGGGEKNLIPPFNEGWTMSENSRMRQANFVGKVSGSTVENPHIYKGGHDTRLLEPNHVNFTEPNQTRYSQIQALDGVVSNVNTVPNNGSSAQHLFSFNLIEHVIRNYGVGVFGSAVTIAERVAWLKANVTKFACNWYGFGSSVAGNKATISVWNSKTSAWNYTTNHINNVVTKLSISRSSSQVDPSSIDLIDAAGFAHFLAYAEPSNGTISSIINTDFVEFEVFMKTGSVPVADYEFTLNATGDFQSSSVKINTMPNVTYTFSAPNQQAGSYYYANEYDVLGNQITPVMFTTISTSGKVVKTITTKPNTSYLLLNALNATGVGASTGVFSFSSPQLEVGSVATAFEPMGRYDINQSPGVVTEAGTVINAALLNKMEQGIADAHVTADAALPKAGGIMTGALSVHNSIFAKLASKVTKYIQLSYDEPADEGRITAVDSGTVYKPVTVLSNGFKYRPSVGTPNATAYDVWTGEKLREGASGLEFYSEGRWIPISDGTIIKPFVPESKPLVAGKIAYIKNDGKVDNMPIGEVGRLSNNTLFRGPSTSGNDNQMANFMYSYQLSTDKYFVVYNNPDSKNVLGYVVTVNSSNVVTITSPVTLTSTLSVYAPTAVNGYGVEPALQFLSAGRFLFTFRVGTPEPLTMYGVVITITGDTISVGTHYLLANNVTSNPAHHYCAPAIAGTKYVASYYSNNGNTVNFVAFTISGSVITVGTPAALLNPGAQQYFSMAPITTDKMIIGYAPNSSTTQTYQIVSTSGLVVSLGAAYTNSSAGTASGLVKFLVLSPTLVISRYMYGGGPTAQWVPMAVSGTTLTLSGALSNTGYANQQYEIFPVQVATYPRVYFAVNNNGTSGYSYTFEIASNGTVSNARVIPASLRPDFPDSLGMIGNTFYGVASPSGGYAAKYPGYGCIRAYAIDCTPVYGSTSTLTVLSDPKGFNGSGGDQLALVVPSTYAKSYSLMLSGKRALVFWGRTKSQLPDNLYSTQYAVIDLDAATTKYSGGRVLGVAVNGTDIALKGFVDVAGTLNGSGIPKYDVNGTILLGTLDAEGETLASPANDITNATTLGTNTILMKDFII